MLPAKRFYMIRHGQTVANARREMAGWLDSPLTDEGRQQASEAAKIVAAAAPRPQSIFYSPLSRAHDTAAIINEALGLPMTPCADIRELHAGDWEGVTYDISYQPIVDGFDPPGGETYDIFRARVRKGLTEGMDAAEGPALFVAHGGVFRAVAGLYGLHAYGFRNCHLYEFEPNPARPAFPWSVWEYDFGPDGKPVRAPAELFAQALEKIAS